MSAVIVDTPYYILMDRNVPAGPKVVPLNPGIKCLFVYGFSDKSAYDKFCVDGQPALAPYPLVKGYLRNQVDAPGDGLKLVLIDAIGARDRILHAATMEAVLKAQENRTAHVTAAYRLMLDKVANAYCVESE